VTNKAVTNKAVTNKAVTKKAVTKKAVPTRAPGAAATGATSVAPPGPVVKVGTRVRRTGVVRRTVAPPAPDTVEAAPPQI